MSTAQKAAPKELFIVFKEKNEYVLSDDGSSNYKIIGKKRLGFAHPNEPGTKAHEKRKATQMSWAYSIYEEKADGVYSREWHGKPLKRVADNLQPAVIQNVPMTGFKIVEYVTRISTTNRVWRIIDPRDFMLEISTENLQDLILNGTIINGLIQRPCIWHTGKILKYA